MYSLKSVFKDIAVAFAVGVGVFFIHGLILYLAGNAWYGAGPLAFFIDNLVFSVPLYLVNQYVFRYYHNKFGQDLWTTGRILLAIFTGVVVSFVTTFFVRMIYLGIITGKPLSYFLETEKISYYYLPLFISVIAISLYYAFFYWKGKQDTKIKQSKLIAGTASAKFDALKNQLDPHFLFNSLNVLASLIEENPVQAQKFTTSLSKVYRYVLEQKNKELVPLDEELAFARTYMNLIKMRFEDSIMVSIPDKASHPDFKVVPLSLQLLLENAVKHNQVTPSKKLHIEILESGNRLVVKNNIQAKQVVKKGSGVGLLNIKQRYHLLTDSEVRVEDNGVDFKVGVPILTAQEQKAFVPSQKEFIADKRYEYAKKKVEALKAFYIHFAIYCLMLPVFIYLNVVSTDFPWALFPILGWGWGILGHAAEVFGWNPLFNKKWESKKIKELMDDEDF